MLPPLRLSNVKPDYESLVVQLQLYLSQKDTWKDLQSSSTGQTLIELIAAVGAFNQFAIESAVRESFLDTAVRDSSVYSIARMLGVRLERKRPASVILKNLTRNEAGPAIFIPAYSGFTVGGRDFFNRIPIQFKSGKVDAVGSAYLEDKQNPTDPDVWIYPNTLVLYEGSIKVRTFPPSAEAFREIALNEPDFIVSDSDVIVNTVRVDNNAIREEWTSLKDGIWTSGASEKVYYDSTDGFGDTVLFFGDGIHGALPGLGYNIEVKYVTTSGSEGSVGDSNLAVTYIEDSTIKGFTQTAVSGGGNQRPPVFYKKFSSQMYRARSRAITHEDYIAISLDYPGVACATVMAERDYLLHNIAVDPTKMNVVKICLLPEDENIDEFTTSEWLDFLDYMENKKHALVQIDPTNPVPIVTEVEVTLSLKTTALVDYVKALVEANIRALFKRGVDSIGRLIAISDISQACMSVEGVDYVTILKPTADLTITPNYPRIKYYKLSQVTINTEFSKR